MERERPCILFFTAKTNVEKDAVDAQGQMGQFEETPRKTRSIRKILRQHKMPEDSNRRTQNLELAIPSNHASLPPIFMATAINSCTYEAHGQRMSTLNGIMEALTDADVNIIGVCGPDNVGMGDILEKVSRRVQRDNLFDVVVMACVTQKPVHKRIQGELADELGLNLVEKSVAKRARRLRDKIKEEQKILVILQELFKGIDLDRVGIPFGADHRGCKILLSSTSEEILSNRMHAQKVFMI